MLMPFEDIRGLSRGAYSEPFEGVRRFVICYLQTGTTDRKSSPSFRLAALADRKYSPPFRLAALADGKDSSPFRLAALADRKDSSPFRLAVLTLATASIRCARR